MVDNETTMEEEEVTLIIKATIKVDEAVMALGVGEDGSITMVDVVGEEVEETSGAAEGATGAGGEEDGKDKSSH